MNPAKQPKILVVGSINMDLITTANRFAQVGETLLGNAFQTLLGGKGANQAVAASRLGADVTLLGAVGDDAFGHSALNTLQSEGVNIDAVQILPNVATGVAAITVAEGENHIVVVPGANLLLSVADIEAHADYFAQADVVICQLEISMECVEAACLLAQKYQKPFILNPAPMQELSAKLLQGLSILTPNLIELQQLIGNDIDETNLQALPFAVVLTAGKEGAFFVNDLGQTVHQPAFLVDAVDSTGAGDTFNAALAVFWSVGLEQAVKKAAAAAALSVTGIGAQTAMPSLVELDDFLNQA